MRTKFSASRRMALMSRVLVLFATLVFTAPSMVFAATLFVDSTGQLTGATGVIVNGEPYDVEFLDGTCVDLFTGCDALSDFTFNTVEEFSAAAQALFDSVFLDGPQGMFDSIPSLTNGCSDVVSCRVSVPSYFRPPPNITHVQTWVASNRPSNGTGAFTADPTLDFTGLEDRTWARFSPTPVIPQGQMRVDSTSSDGANENNVLDGDSATFWRPLGAGPPHDMVLDLGGSYIVSALRYLPHTFTRCTQYEVYVSVTNGDWGPAVASGTWGTDNSEKTASFASTPGAFVRIVYLNPYCYAAEHNVVGVAVAVSGGNTAPTITSNGGGPTAAVSVPENQTAVTTVMATDTDLPPDVLTYFFVSGSADLGAFSIGASSGVLTFNAAPDFENPHDFGGNNVYNISVQVNDGQGGFDTQTLTVQVTDVVEGGGGGGDHGSLATDHANLATGQTNLGTQIGAVTTEMAAQHDMLKTGQDDTQTALGATQTAIAEVKALVQGMTLPLCGVGTEGQRFVEDGTEVCDNTTGLYWVKTPDATRRNHATAVIHCATLDLSNSQTYRLPEMQELVNLLDYSQFNPALPAGHSFVNVQLSSYWSATTVANFPTGAWLVIVGAGNVKPDFKTLELFVWCVRSGS